MRVGAAQFRALISMSTSQDGTAAVHWTSASGLIVRGLAKSVSGALGDRPYPLCKITEAGRRLVADLGREAA